MSTNSLVGILRENENIEVMYVQYDGYPSQGVGTALINKYNSPSLVEELLKFGGCVSLTSKKIQKFNIENSKYENAKQLKYALKTLPENIDYIYLWIEHDCLWKFVDTKDIDNFIVLKTFLNKE
jgi:hypothetical protein